MNPDPLPPDVETQNIERLLGKAYHPDNPDPDFVQAVTRRLCAEARSAARSRSAPPALRFDFRRLAWAAGVAAALALVSLGLRLLSRPPSGPDLVTHDDTASPPAARRAEAAPERLTPRPRPPSPAVPALEVGATVQTTAGQRRVCALPDGSTLFVNEQTTVRLDGPRQVTLTTGEVFVEVAPRAPAAEGATFLVKTPTREVAALGTRFDVRAEQPGTSVLVTQGQVKVSDVGVLAHGQLLPARDTAPQPAPRSTHLLGWTQDLLAAVEAPLLPANVHQGGQLLVSGPDGQQAQLSLRRCHIDVHIEDGFARTTIDQTYFNHENRRLEGTFYFPLPADASLSRLAMYVDGNLMEGGMAERGIARAVYESIVRRAQDPALLEWVDGTTFKMRVFPLEPRQEKRILLSYTQRLPGLYGHSHYRFPAGHSLEMVRDWSFHALVKGGARLGWHCPSHELTATRDGQDLLLDARAQQVKVDRDVVLDFEDRDQAGARDGVRLSSAEHEDARYLMLRYRPVLPGKAATQRRDWVFLFESSGDRDPLLARVGADVVRTLLESAEHDDTFTVLSAGSRVRSFNSEPLPATAANVRAAGDFLDRSHLIGALDLKQALEEARPLLEKAQNPYLVHVGSALAALGERRTDALLRLLPEKARYVGVGVGKRWNRSFMKVAAERTGGYFTQINPDERVSWRARDLLATLNTPRLLQVQVVDNAEKVKFLCDHAAVAQGEELCAIARVDGKDELPKAVTVRGLLDGQPFERVLPVKDVSPKADYLPRTWARLEIERLLAEDATRHKEQIVALSKAMYVMTPFTSLLVLENEAMYQQYKVDRGRKDHWAMSPAPQKIPVVREPVPAGRPEERNPAVPARRPADEVLRTILVRLPAPAIRLVSRPGQETIIEDRSGQQDLTNPDIGLDPDVPLHFNVDRIEEISVPGALDPSAAVGVPGLGQVEQNRLKDLTQMWGHLPEKERARALPELTRNLPPRQREVIENYFKTLGSRGGGRWIEAPPMNIPDGTSNTIMFAERWPDGLVPTPGGFSGRSGATREHLLREAGGTALSEAAVAGGLIWLAKHQAPDGRWSLDRFHLHYRDKADGDGPRAPTKETGQGTKNDVAGTALGLLPFLAAGQTHRPPPPDGPRYVSYHQVVAHGLKFLLAVQQKDGDFGGGLFAHALATTAVCEAFGMSGDANLKPAAQRALDFIVRSQDVTTGGWRLVPAEASCDTVVTAWQLAALKSGQVAGLRVPLATLRHASRWLDFVAAADGSGYGASRPGTTPTTTAAGLLGRQYLGWGPGNRALLAGADRVQETPPGKLADVTYHYFATQVMHHLSGRRWQDWNQPMRDWLLKQQDTGARNPAQKGSWGPDGDAQGGQGGRLLQTSLSLLILEVYYRYLPLCQSDATRFRGFTHQAPTPPEVAYPVLALSSAGPDLRLQLDAGTTDAAAERLLARLLQGAVRRPDLYVRPACGRDDRLFTDLLGHAPAMNTSRADVLAVLEAEAVPDPRTAPGVIDPAARELIDRARAGGWQAVTLPAVDGQPALSVVHDGSGRYAYERILPSGLRERVVCDGRTLLHLYPELGVGARRAVGRSHRAEFAALVPGTLPTAEDLARGADLKALDRSTVALVPHSGDATHLRLLFGAAGHLAERQMVDAAGKVLRRETYSPDGVVRLLDADGKEVSARKLERHPATAPDLRPDVKDLVVLPMPVRTRDHLIAELGARWQGVEKLDDDTAPAILATGCATGPADTVPLVRDRLGRRHDRRAGLQVILAASGAPLDEIDIGDAGRATPLGVYLRWLKESEAVREPGQTAGLGSGLLPRLVAFHELSLPWLEDAPDTVPADEVRRLFDFVKRGGSPDLVLALVDLVLRAEHRKVADRGDLPGLKRDLLTAVCQSLAGVPRLGYIARYEQARLALLSGDPAQASQLFRGLYARALDEGQLPAIDAAFRQALQTAEKDADGWRGLVRGTAARLLAKGRLADLVELIGQCRELDDPDLAAELLPAALEKIARHPQRLGLSLAAVEYLLATKQFEQADRLLEGLLAEKEFAGRSLLWRLRARVAGWSKQQVTRAACLERALEIEYRRPPEEIDLLGVRRDHGELLAAFQKQAAALAALQQAPPADLPARVVRAADRWRALDAGNPEPCLAAARVLRELGQVELAWDYRTTAALRRDSEPPDWSHLGQAFVQEGDRDLAECAYRAATDADPDNARLLWERALNLEQAGRQAETRRLFGRLAEGGWREEFQSIQDAARRKLSERD
jgi:tetratricopeptide (TPR) repeat protein